ncbi:transposase, partial [Micrococcus yunnanensis]|uniref:transposase n=1 Tax=Micrococcus yunnanensis TaxID=566027 RepID=UPI003908B58E
MQPPDLCPLFQIDHPPKDARKGSKFPDAQGSVFTRRRHGIAWRDLPEVYGPWQTVWTWHRRLAEKGTWDTVLATLTAAAD